MRRPCRICGNLIVDGFLNLGASPPSNAYLRDLRETENTYPLGLLYCESCEFFQLSYDVDPAVLFNDEYAYRSSASVSWKDHCRRLATEMAERFDIGGGFVVEIASNDGYFLEILQEAGFSCAGIEPCTDVANISIRKGHKVINRFFGKAVAAEVLSDLNGPDWIIANNVLAHVPSPVDFLSGVTVLSSEKTVITVEVPYAFSLLLSQQFDTIYHEHYSYYTLKSLLKLFNACGLRVFDAEVIPTHGESIRVFGCLESAIFPDSSRMENLLRKENKLWAGLCDKDRFAENIQARKIEVLQFLQEKYSLGKKIVGYGAAAKANTILNFFGVNANLIDFFVDKSDLKVGKFMPGSHIPIHRVEHLSEVEIDIIIIFPWNIMEEIMTELAEVSALKGVEIFILSPRLSSVGIL